MQRILFFILIILNFHAFACQCPQPNPLNAARLNLYSSIFLGKVISVGPCDETGSARVRVDEIYKGTAAHEIKLEFDCSSSCMMNFNNGEAWIIYGTQLRPDLIKVSACSESRKALTKKEDDMFYFLSGKTFEEECEWLRKNSGVKPFFVQGTEQLHYNQKPDRSQILWLIGISVITLLILIFAFKKWLR